MDSEIEPGEASLDVGTLVSMDLIDWELWENGNGGKLNVASNLRPEDDRIDGTSGGTLAISKDPIAFENGPNISIFEHNGEPKSRITTPTTQMEPIYDSGRSFEAIVAKLLEKNSETLDKMQMTMDHLNKAFKKMEQRLDNVEQSKNKRLDDSLDGLEKPGHEWTTLQPNLEVRQSRKDDPSAEMSEPIRGTFARLNRGVPRLHEIHNESWWEVSTMAGEVDRDVPLGNLGQKDAFGASRKGKVSNRVESKDNDIDYGIEEQKIIQRAYLDIEKLKLDSRTKRRNDSKNLGSGTRFHLQEPRLRDLQDNRSRTYSEDRGDLMELGRTSLDLIGPLVDEPVKAQPRRNDMLDAGRKPTVISGDTTDDGMDRKRFNQASEDIREGGGRFGTDFGKSGVVLESLEKKSKREKSQDAAKEDEFSSNTSLDKLRKSSQDDRVIKREGSLKDESRPEESSVKMEVGQGMSALNISMDKTDKEKQSGFRVPSGMPKFRMNGGIQEPLDFIAAFGRVMKAHGIPENRYMELILLCMDSTDVDFVEQFMEENEERPWEKFSKAFVAHFQHPNTAAILQGKIRQLRMSDLGAQKYSDQFMKLMKQLGWPLDSELAIYQYKLGLTKWMVEQLSAAEASLVLHNEIGKAISVEILARMVLKIDANKSIQSVESNQLGKQRFRQSDDPMEHNQRLKNGECFKCGKKGHFGKDCPLKKTAPMKQTAEPVRSAVVKPLEKVICNKCKQSGHYANRCPLLVKDVRMVHVEDEEEKDEGKQILTLCNVNGVELVGLVDTGASTSFVDINVVESNGWKISPRPGIIRQAMDGSSKSRIGVVEGVEFQNGSTSIKVNLEVANLNNGMKLIIGLNLFGKLNFELKNVPFTKPSVNEGEVPVERSEEEEEEADSVNENGIAEEWKAILEDNARLPVSSVCKLEGSELEIPTGNNKPVWRRQYPIAPGIMDKVAARIKEWQENGWIEEAPEDGQWNLPLLAVPKAGKEPGVFDDVRVCLDARALNDIITEKPDSSLPSVREVINKQNCFLWISLLDLADSYMQFLLKKEDRVKTSFTFNGKRYMFCVVPFGLNIMTGHMQKIMEKLLGPVGKIPFQDDVGITSKSREEHIKEVKEVLELITYKAGLRLRLKKCIFFKKEARLLGMILSREGIRMDPAKVKAILNWERPMDGKSMMRFMGAANFHREFTHEFAKIAAPLDECRNMKTIEWTEERIEAWNSVKRIFSEDILLRHIDWEKTMYLTTDASIVGVGAWIGQKDEKGIIHPVICISKKLSPIQRRWSATKRELFALVWAMNKLRYYLLGRKFVARVDHKPLVGLVQNKMTLMLENWMDTILEFNFTTQYYPGEENGFADALSRSFEEHVDLKEIFVEEEDARALWEAERRGMILPSEELRVEIVEKEHALGHLGVESMCKKIQSNGYWWPKMRKNIESVIGNCLNCLRFNVQSEGFHPSKSIIADAPWDHIEIDLIGPIYESANGKVHILTIVDVCTGYTILRAIASKDMKVVARTLWEVMCDYGLPKIMQSDNGAEFVNQVLEAMTELFGIEKRLITAYNPRANGLVERRNREVEKLLKKFVMGSYGGWDDYLPLVQMSLNQQVSQRTGSSAFSLMFGRSANGFEDYSKVESMDDIEKAMDKKSEMWKKFKESVLPGVNLRNQEVKKKQRMDMDKRKRGMELRVGDKVMAIDSTKESKWSPAYEGPFTIAKVHKGGTYTLKDETGENLDRRRTISMLKYIASEKDSMPKTSGGESGVRKIWKEKSHVAQSEKVAGSAAKISTVEPTTVSRFNSMEESTKTQVGTKETPMRIDLINQNSGLGVEKRYNMRKRTKEPNGNISNPKKQELKRIPKDITAKGESEYAKDASKRQPVAEKSMAQKSKYVKKAEKKATQGSDEEKNWVIEKIVQAEKRGDQYYYLVKWKGYKEEDNTWEPASNFNDSGSIIKYWRLRKRSN